MNGKKMVGAVCAILVGGIAQAQVTQRASLGTGGIDADATSTFPEITPDGRYVAFESDASNLVAGDTNGGRDVFVRDVIAGTNERVSVDSAGQQAFAGSSYAAISADGRYVAFESYANNLVPGDTNSWADVFLRDRVLGTTERLSVSSTGVQGNRDSHGPSISSDGRYVAFMSMAWNLAPGDGTSTFDIFLRDRATGTTTFLSRGLGGVPGNHHSYWPSISANGQYVAFHSVASNLVPGDVNGTIDVFVYELRSATTELVSVGPGGLQGNFASLYASISGDGRFVAYHSLATNLVAGDTNSMTDVFVRDRVAGTTQRVSLDSAGAEGNGDSSFSAISADGRYVAFESTASNLVASDTNAVIDMFLRDRTTGSTERMSVDSAGVQGNGDSQGWPALSADGRFVAFYSLADNLVALDRNACMDVFVHDRNAAGFSSVCHPGADGVIACPCSNPPSGTGRGCNNSIGTGGASLTASGVAYVSMDSLVFTTSGEKPTSLSIVLQGSASSAAGLAYGQGVMCTQGTLKRLYTKNASGGSVTAPNLGAGDPSVSVRSSALGDPIPAGQSRWYLVYYRDPVVLGGCPAANTFNATQTGQVAWWP